VIEDVADEPAHRKKYRKMRMRFEAQMNESNALFKDEHKALALARRLQEQNEYHSPASAYCP